MIAACLYKVCRTLQHPEQHASESKNNAIQQLKNVMNMTSDAKQATAVCEFQFGIQHHRPRQTLCIMHDLRLPEDAAEVIAETCTDAKIKIKLYFAETGPINVERGTVPEDTLSPLLFVIFC